MPRPHAPTSICGTAVAYDANGNTLSYDADGAGAQLPRELLYDGENRPLAVVQNGAITRFAYGSDRERAVKALGHYLNPSPSETWYFDPDRELLYDSLNPGGRATSWLHQYVKREVSLANSNSSAPFDIVNNWALNDHLASNRLVTFMPGQAANRAIPVPRARIVAGWNRGIVNARPSTRYFQHELPP